MRAMLTLETAPTEDPVTLADAKAHLVVEHALDDALIAALITTATAMVEGLHGETGRSLMPQAWSLTGRDFPGCRTIFLPRGPVVSIDAVTYFDPDGVQQTWPTANYSLRADAFKPVLVYDDDADVPSVDERHDAVKITYTAGYADAAAVPAPVKHAILLMVGELYANRGDKEPSKTTLAAIDRLLSPYRVFTHGNLHW